LRQGQAEFGETGNSISHRFLRLASRQKVGTGFWRSAMRQS